MNTKTIITAMLLLFNLTGFAQTKEETIAWIKENLEEYGGTGGIVSYSFIDVIVTPCNITFIEKNDDNDKPLYKYNFNPSEAKKWTVEEEAFVGLYISADKRIIKQTNLLDDTNEKTSNIPIKGGESGIHKRLIKAIIHLATFCEQKN